MNFALESVTTEPPKANKNSFFKTLLPEFDMEEQDSIIDRRS
jgi:hypothetical protein